METITAQALSEKLKKEKTVEVCGMAFRIRKAPLLLLADETDDLWQTARQSREAVAKKIKFLISSPSLPRMRRVLMAGMIEPRLSLQHEDGTVCVDLILADHQLSAGLFIEIVTFSLEAGDTQLGEGPR
jgi:hypothetical protein